MGKKNIDLSDKVTIIALAEKDSSLSYGDEILISGSFFSNEVLNPG